MTKTISALDFARGLFFALVFIMWGSRDLIAYHWHESSTDQQIKAAAVGISVGTFIAAYLFKGPIVWAFF